MDSCQKTRPYRRLLGLIAILFLLVPFATAEDGLYILDREGGLHRVGTTQADTPVDTNGTVIDLELTEDGHGIYALDDSGSILSGGDGAAALKGLDLEPWKARRVALSRLGFAVLDDQGQIHFGGGQPPFPEDVVFGWDVAQDIELTPQGDGMVILDRFGGLHYQGEVPRFVGPFFGWDIARDIELSPDGRGYYVLDGFGFIHSVGPIRSFAGRNLGWDIARDLELTQSGQGYYILDGFGCLHIDGDAVPFDTPFFGWDTAVDLEISPRPMGALSGQVLDGNSDGALEPVGGALISLVRIDLPEEFIHRVPGSGLEGPRQTLRPIRTQAGPDGGYRFESVPAGSYAVTVAARGYEPYQGEVEVPAGQETLQDFVLFAQECPPPSGEYGSVVGTVAEDTGPLDVLIVVPGARVSIQITHRFALTTRTNEQGEFAFPHVPAGNHRIHVCAEGYFPADQMVEVEPETETYANFLLLPRATGTGRVFGKVWYDSMVDCASGTDCLPYDVPIPGASLHLFPRDYEVVRNPSDGTNLCPEPGTVGWHTISDASGLYEFNGIPCGPYILVVRAEGYAPARVEFLLGDAPAQPAVTVADATDELPCELELDVQLYPLVEEYGSIFGTVRAASPGSLLDLPLAGAVVHAIPLALEAGPGRLLPGEDQGYVVVEDGILRPWRFFRVTDENGDYRFEQLPPGRYQLVVTAEGYQAARREVALPPNETLEENFVLVPVVHPTGRIEGVVAGGLPEPATAEVPPEPLEGAVVILIPAPRPRPTGPDDVLPVEDAILEELGSLPELISDMEVSRRFRRVTTAADGSYSFERVPLGHYRLVAKARGYFPQCQPADVFEDTTTTVDFVLRPLPPLRWGSLIGSVTDTLSGDPVPRAVVTVWPLNCQPLEQPQVIRQWANRPEFERPGYRPLRTLTDENGDYEFPRLLVGPYRITVRAWGYEPALGRVRIVEDETAVRNFGLRPLPPEGGVFGQVSERTSDGTPGPPIPGALVVLIPWDLASAELDRTGILDDANDPAGHIFRTRTNLQGEYEFPQVPAGRYLMRVQKYGFEPARRRVAVPPGTTVREDFALRPVGPPPSGSVIGAVYALSATESVEPEPIEGAFVSLFRLPGGTTPAGHSGGPGHFFARTNEAGEYEFDEVPAGGYLLFVYASGYQPDFRLVEVLADEITHADFFLEPLGGAPEGRIFGTVFEGLPSESLLADLEPIPRAHMLLFRLPLEVPVLSSLEVQPLLDFLHPPLRSTWTNEEGRYTFEALPGDQYVVFALKEGFEPDFQVVDLAPGAEEQADFQLMRLPEPPPPEEAAIVYGVVRTEIDSSTEPEGTLIPVPGALVTAVPEDGALLDLSAGIPEQPPIATRTNIDGSYRLPPLAPGSWVVSVLKPGFAPAQETIILAASEEREMNFQLAREALPGAGCFEGRVWAAYPLEAASLPERLPVPGAHVSLAPDSIQPFLPIETWTDERGHFRFAVLPVDGYTVVIEKEGFEPVEARIEIVAGDVVHEEYEMIPQSSMASTR